MNISAIVVTSGEACLDPVVGSLRGAGFDDIVVWDNSSYADMKVWGRHEALALAKHPVIYSQDDDLVHSPESIGRILRSYQPGVLTGCMWPSWSAGARAQAIPNGYDDLVFPGSGSVYDANLALDAATRYSQHWPIDDFFMLWCDCIIGLLTPNRQLDERFDILPAAHTPNRMSRLPNGVAHKREAIRRARQIRDMEAS